MRVQKENKAVWLLAVCALFVSCSSVVFNSLWSDNGDYIFLYNRLFQIYDCLRNGYFPFIYYEDVGGIGYGSPIFYGQLTLVPFLLFVASIDAFVKAYSLCSLLLNFFGFRFFLKRVSDHATLVACFYITSMPFLGLYNGSLPANCFAVGISWFFLGYCIDFFRDGRNGVFVTLTYFLVWQSNFNTTVICTLVCFALFVVYFRRSHFWGYVKLLLGTLVVVSYDIVNMLVHIDALRFADAETVLSRMSQPHDIKVFSIHPFGGYLYRGSSPSIDYCNGFMTFGVLAVFVYCLIKGFGQESLRFRVCSVLIGVVAVVGYVIGTYDIWRAVYKATDIFFQFPVRYYIYIFGFVLAVFARVVRPQWFVYVALVLCLFDIAVAKPFHPSPDYSKEYWYWQIGNYEYASDSFVRSNDVYHDYSSGIHSYSGVHYSSGRSYNVVFVDCSSNPGRDIITLPKLYYKGYRAVGENGERFVVSSGFSNYCEINLGNYTGKLYLTYRVPPVVLFFFLLQIACVSSMLYYIVKWRLVAFESAKRK